MPTSDDGTFSFIKDTQDPVEWWDGVVHALASLSQASTRIGLGLICAGSAIAGAQMVSAPHAEVFGLVALSTSGATGAWFLVSALRSGVASRALR